MDLLSHCMHKTSHNKELLLFLPFFILSILYIKIGIYRYVLLAALLIPLIIVLMGRRVVVKRKYIVLFMFFSLQFVFSLLHTSFIQSVKNTAQYFINLSPIFIYDLVVKNYRSKNSLKTFNLVQGLFFITIVFCVVASIYYVRSSPYALRDLSIYDATKGDDSNSFFVAIGGGYPLLFAVLILLPFLIFKVGFRSSYRIKYIILSILFIIAILYLFVIAGVTTCVIVATGTIVLSLLFKKKKKTAVAILLILALFVLLFLLIPGFLENSINFIAELFKDNVIIYTRLKEIVPTLLGGDRSSSFGMRVNCLLKDFRTIIRYPLLGAGFHHGYDYMTLAEYVGWHSEWFDVLAEFGLLLGGMFFYFISKSFKDVLKSLASRSHRKIYLVSGIATLIMGFLDPILTTNMLLVLFILLPLCFNIERLDEKKYEKKATNCHI